ncbi:epidermal retinol dehydrogenase 2 [Terrapene carolina triunguis]|uniref:Short chain dehydrogenase/reductase family 16C member 5 n=1 Tax=Terrapene triunguis TaxID=2587831 RepID=A0A674JIF8_9SAUR|nr:epidermal retinol dehydrogenase 2 [Terrapene carolina triunguis]XP_024054034.1 epidermal retinol dehydrogenase 2 [Terrapene carolina triunguis]XP_024054035.1 epidermal retinol dehydrogenase 2 [Terrapene carolina triunguis]XP_024054036.1 epidermal retinol dehydrogenase 2 [Terrapene carolina triunguis]XP_024054037.1 epidermal retinol dehydrogenase 2 [Terrapene carolina triunguis]XP_024054038.1 epidermal retinol dehydrogenase 2 [Terrapene carolina triunguis]XP_024054039.1 epidermal retinol de
MNFFLETLKVLVLSIYFLLESLVLLFVPVRKKSVAGEIVLITGAGSGIGRLLALKFARLGVTLVLWDINQEGNKETSKLARENGAVRVHAYLCDCSKRQEIYRVADQVKKEVGDVSILINNAGVVTGKKFIDSPDSLVEKTMEVNTMAHFWTCKAFLPAMMASNHGHLVSIASSAGLIGVNGLADYCASKFAAVGFAEAVGLEMLALGKTGIKTTIVCPYFINTGMFDGCKTKWPCLLPILDSNYAAEKIVSAIQREQVLLLMPRSLYFLCFLKSILPVKMGILLGDYAGAFHFMDHFRGRVKKD